MLASWIVLSLVALLIWGVWGVFANLTAQRLDGLSALVWEVVGAAIVGAIVVLWLVRYQGLETETRGVTFGIATGISYTIGLAFVFFALRTAGMQTSAGGTVGSVSTVLILTALYPIVSTALNHFVLSEPISARQIAGMTVALAGIAILVSD